ncbi:MAG TPA: hypothetical protein VGO47_11740, partial [Chlamydiales bacterium]|nr:hypothetical protein [Chlamydiales bacterium]
RILAHRVATCQDRILDLFSLFFTIYMLYARRISATLLVGGIEYKEFRYLTAVVCALTVPLIHRHLLSGHTGASN